MWRAYGRLMRLSLAPSAVADVVAGLVFASNGAWPLDARAWWLVPASLGVYHGALVLNDWNDRDHDARTRPQRPLVSGAVAPRAALLLGLVLVVSGVAAASLAAPSSGVWMGAVALLALAYDWAGRGPWVGPLLLGTCRALNLGAGVFFVAVSAGRLDLGAFAPCLAYGAYVFSVSRLGRMEDAEDSAPLGSRPRTLLIVIAALLFAPLCVPPVFAVERVAALVVALWAASGLLRAAVGTKPWTRPLVESAMGACLRRLLAFAAIVTLLRASQTEWAAWIAAAVIGSGYALSHALRRVFPPS
ncbi:MAG: UbiA family prenyltransferase [Planctomycetes bacterium]|nr:UbiA family prenyltransferase [Planctomycetota bacterium]